MKSKSKGVHKDKKNGHPSKTTPKNNTKPVKLSASKSLAKDIPVSDELIKKYARGETKIKTNKTKFKSLRKTLVETQESIFDSAIKNASTEILLPADSGGIESSDTKVFKIKQKDLKEHLDLNTSKNMIDLHLTKFGPYRTNYTPNGRYLLFGGQKGHVAVLDSLNLTVSMELQLQEEVYDVQYLHNETMFAVAQNKYTYIYDNKGVEIHCLKNHERPYRLDFLPYHFLLTSVGHSGWIKWQDVSTGTYVAGYSTGHGPCKVLKHNPKNAVSHLGHTNGVVSLWSPAAGKSLVSMFCHKAPITDLSVDRDGMYMATSSLDGYLKIWDLRQYRLLHAYKPDRPVVSLDISDRGMIALGLGRSVQILKDAFRQPSDVTYLQHSLSPPGAAYSSGSRVKAAVNSLASSMNVSTVSFRPYEDVLSIGHSHGITNIIVPGAGEPNFDSFENNPFINPKQRREAEVKSLLYKLSPDMIGLDSSFVAGVDKDQIALEKEHKDIFTIANSKELSKKETNKMRGRNKISAKLRRKQKNVIDASSVKLKEKLKQKNQALDSSKLDPEEQKKIHREKHGALQRFFSKSTGTI